MPPLQPLRAATAAAARSTSTSATTTTSLAARYQPRTVTRSFSRTPRTNGGGHESHYDPPSGWLWGIKPGEKYQKEGWEGIWYWGFYGSCAFLVVAYAFKPDTSIQTWALEEARRRLEAEGILEDPDNKKE